MRRLKSELEGANCSASERESHLKGQEATLKMEAAKERASLTGQLEAANKQIRTLKTEVSKKALVAEEARLGLDNLRQEREEAVERINVEATRRLADMQERVSELSAKNKVLSTRLGSYLQRFCKMFSESCFTSAVLQGELSKKLFSKLFSK